MNEQERKVMEQVFEALEALNNTNNHWWQEVDKDTVDKIEPAITALKEVLTQQNPQNVSNEQVELECYDAGLLGSGGGGDVDWWQDYIRAEFGRAHDFYQSQIDTHPPVPYVTPSWTAQPEQKQELCPSCRNSDIYACTCTFKPVQPKEPEHSAPHGEPVAWGNLANWCLDSDRVLITDKDEAAKYHKAVYDLTPLYTHPQPTQDLTDKAVQERLATSWGYVKNKRGEA